MPNGPNPEWVYYHSLYHLVYHWAAYVAFLVLLITIGLVPSVSAVPRSKLYIGFAIVVSGVASGFFFGECIHSARLLIRISLALPQQPCGLPTQSTYGSALRLLRWW